MNKIKSGMIFLMAVAFFTVLVVHAQSNKQAQPKKAKQKAVPVQLKNKVEPKQVTPVSIPERLPFKDSRQGYKMVTDVLDGFGGKSESNNYKIPVNSGGQPSAIGISTSNSYMVKAGYVHAAQVKRGDVNADGIVDLGDVVYLISYLYRGGPEPRPLEAGDVTANCVVDVGDVVYLISYLYRDGPPPPC